MTHCTYRSRVRVGHQTATGPVTPTCSWDRWGRAETERTALGEALVMRRRTRVRFPPPPPRGLRRFREDSSQNDEPPRTSRSGAVRRLVQPSGGHGDRLQVAAAEAAQVLGVDGLRLLLRQVAEAPVRRVGLQQRVVGRAAAGAVVPVAELLLVEHAGLDRGDDGGHRQAGQPVLTAAGAVPAGVLQDAEGALDERPPLELPPPPAAAVVLPLHQLALV